MFSGRLPDEIPLTFDRAARYFPTFEWFVWEELRANVEEAVSARKRVVPISVYLNRLKMVRWRVGISFLVKGFVFTLMKILLVELYPQLGFSESSRTTSENWSTRRSSYPLVELLGNHQDNMEKLSCKDYGGQLPRHLRTSRQLRY